MAKKTNYTKHGIDYYRITATVGFDLDGKRIRKEFLGKSKKDATEKRDSYMESIKNGFNVGYEKLTFSEYFDDWLQVVLKPTIALSSYNRYEGCLRMWIRPSCFYMDKLTDIKSIAIQKHLNSIASPHTAKLIYNLLNNFFKYCIKERIMIFNPLDNVTLRKTKPTKREEDKYLSRQGIERLLEAYKEDPSLLLFVFDMLTGLREGELCAMTHKDMNFDKLMINIDKSLRRESSPDKDGVMRTQVRINPPKTESSIRVVPMPFSLMAALKVHAHNEKKKHMRLGIPFNDECYFFTTSICTPLRGDRLNEKLKKVEKKLGITPIVNFHGLRHTFCTLLARKNVPIQTAAKLMGHSTTETTKIYTHVDLQEKVDAIELLQGMVQ